MIAMNIVPLPRRRAALTTSGWGIFETIAGVASGLFGGLFGGSPVAALANQPALTDSESEELRQRLLDAQARELIDVCTPGLATYDMTACAVAQGRPVPQTRDEETAYHYSRDTTSGDKCGALNLLCHMKLQDPDGNWLPIAEWPVAAKIAGGVVGVIALGATVSLVRTVTSLFTGK